MLRILTPDDYRVMPWKNGGGTTTEIWIQPEHAGWESFDWRVGIADIASSGPFSSFPGVDRSILLLDCPPGSSMRLSVDGRDIELPLHAFIDFPGEATTHGSLIGTPVRDFNVMSRRSRVQHACGWRTIRAGASLTLAEGTSCIHVADGSLLLRCGEDRHVLNRPMSALIADGPAVLDAVGRDASIVWTRFTAVTVSLERAASEAQ